MNAFLFHVFELYLHIFILAHKILQDQNHKISPLGLASIKEQCHIRISLPNFKKLINLVRVARHCICITTGI